MASASFLFIKQRAKLRPTSLKTLAQGRGRDSQNLRRLILFKFFDADKQDDLAQGWSKRLDGLLDLCDGSSLRSHVLRTGQHIFDRLPLSPKPSPQLFPARLSSPSLVEIAVARHRVQPRSQPSLGRQARRVTSQLNEGVLQQIIGQIATTTEPQQKGIDPHAIVLVDGQEGLRPALAQTHDPLGLLGRVAVLPIARIGGRLAVHAAFNPRNHRV